MVTRSGVLFTPADRHDSARVKMRIHGRAARRRFIEAMYNTLIIISDLADRTILTVRSLSVYSILVLGTGAVGLVLIRFYTAGLLNLPLMLLFMLGTGLIAMLLMLYATLAARRAATHEIQTMRRQLPDWLKEA